MAVFSYKTIGNNGAIEIAEATAASEAELVSKLASEGKQVVAIALTKKNNTTKISDRKRFTLEQQARIFDDLAVLLNAGMTADVALKAVATSGESKLIKSEIGEIAARLAEGKSLSIAVGESGRFADEAVALISSGEASSKLGNVFSTLAEDFTGRAKARKTLIEALIYPAFLVILALAAVLLITFFLVPALVPIFESANAKPPLIISVLNGLGEFFRQFAPFLGISIAVLIAMFLLPTTRRTLARGGGYIWLRLPYIGGFQKRLTLARYLQSLSLLLGNGIQITDALKLAATTCSVAEISQKLTQVHQDVAQGVRLPKAFEETGLFSESTLSLISIGDEVNRLPNVLEKAGYAIKEQVLRQTNRMLALLTPAITILLGLLIGMLVVTVMTTLLSVNDLAIQ